MEDFFGMEPVELYEFTAGNRVERYTDADFPTTFNGVTYSPVPLRRDAINTSGTLDKAQISIVLPRDSGVTEWYRIYPPSDVVNVVIRQTDPDTQSAPVIWSGRVLVPQWDPREETLSISCEPISSGLRRVGLRRHWQLMCPHALYGDRCRSNKAAHTFPATVVGVSGRTVTFAAAPNDTAPFMAGMVEWMRDGNREIRQIVHITSSGGQTSYLLSGLTTGMSVGDTVNRVHGCGHSLDACRDLHNNAPNFGGCPDIPLKNPVGMTSPYV